MLLAISSNRAFGQAGALLAFAAAIVGILCGWWGMRTRNSALLRQLPRYAYMAFGGAVLSVAMMQRALAMRDWEVAYVQQVGSDLTPTLYNIAAMWSSLEGSILLWLVVLAGFVALVGRHYRHRADDPLVAWALIVLFVILGFFAVLAFGPASPFGPGRPGINFGPGPNQLLQNHVLVLFHPPIIYLGFTGLAVPFAFALAALITGRVGEGWLLETRRWALFGWAFLTTGIILGGWWSYEVLGWGGVWGWDPVENASLLPWLTATAYIHSVLVQERRGMLRVWNLSLLIATFALTILGTYLTRSGLLNSVHAFGAGAVGNYLLVFFAAVVLVSLALIGWRGDRLRSPGTIDSPLSREAAFLANNLLFALFAFVVLLGTIFPLLVEALQSRQIKIGAPYFQRMTMPIGLTLLFLMAVAPVLPWRKASEELLRQRLFWPAVVGLIGIALGVAGGISRWPALTAFGLGGWAAGSALRQLALAARRNGWRGFVGRANGGMVVHLGVIAIAVALAASSSYSRTATLTLTVGEPVTWDDHTFELTAIRATRSPESCDLTVPLSCRTTAVVADVLVDGRQEYSPAITRYTQMGTEVPTPSVRTGVTRDVYLTLDGRPEVAGDSATIQASVKPMIVWLWVGGALMLVGTLLSMFPGKRRRPTAPVSEPAGARPSAAAGAPAGATAEVTTHA